jgi:hypothetical protein
MEFYIPPAERTRSKGIEKLLENIIGSVIYMISA